VNIPRALCALALSIPWVTPGNATPAVAVETHFLLRIEALAVEKGQSTPAGVARDAEAGPSQPASVDLVVPWRPGEGSLNVHLEVRLTSFGPDGEAILFCASSATLAGSKPVVASREIRLAEEGSGLFEVFGDAERRLVLTLHGEKAERVVVRPPAVLGAPVRFLIAVERVDGERTLPLETDELNTFVGQSVEYSFRLGQDAGLEAVRLTLLPVAVSGDLLTIDAEISGALPGADGTTLVSRRERIVASRRATSRVSATAGTPPAGYQFQVTPEF
jgi:hypothetical protein